jgi:hypothetical protein
VLRTVEQSIASLASSCARRRLSSCVVLFACALAVACHSAGEVRLQTGPLIANDPASAYSAGFRTNVGEPYTFSDVILRNEGDEPATITDVRLVHPQGMNLLGALIGVTPGRDYPSGARGFPPPYSFSLEQAAGAVIPPTKDSERETLLVVGLKSTDPGIQSALGIEIDYRLPDGTTFTLPVRYSIALCAPRSYFERHKWMCVAPPPGASSVTP